MTAAAWLLLLLAPLSLVTADELPRGEVIPSLACLGAPDQSYALYLPSGYSPERPHPILICFDPGGQGGIPVALFRDGAERADWIVVGSHNSRNGPWEVILRAARALWLDTHARFAVDDGRVFAAGFSGGARAACGLGRMLSVQLAGVIGCGAGLPEWLEPADMAAVPWFGTVGLRDFNFQEMQELERRLRRQGSPCLLRLFHGGHAWPPVALAREAVAWLDALRPAEAPPRSDGWRDPVSPDVPVHLDRGAEPPRIDGAEPPRIDGAEPPRIDGAEPPG